MMIFNKAKLVGALIAIMAATPALADPKPKGAKPVDAQTLANMYVGTSQTWKGCKGGIYYGGKYEAQAYCSKEGESVGVGKWTVDRKGRVCHELIWYWPQGKGVGSKPQDKKECVAHLMDANGNIWRNWNNDKDWWQLGPKDMIKGFKLKRKVKRLRKKLSV